MTKIDSLLLLLKQYNLKNNEMSNLIEENKNNENELITKSLSLDELLSNLNLNNNNLNQLIAQELLDLNLPLAKYYFSEIEDFLSNINLSEENLDLQTAVKIALLIKKLNLPLNLNFFELFKETANQEETIVDNIDHLLELLDNLSENEISTTENIIEEPLQGEEKNTTIDRKLAPLLNNFKRDLTLSDSKKDRVVKLLNDFLTNHNLIPEKEKLEQLALIFNDYSQNSTDNLLELKPKIFNTLFSLLFNLDNSTENNSSISILPNFEEIINSNQEILELSNKNLSEKELKKVSDLLLTTENKEIPFKRAETSEPEKIIEKIADLIIESDNLSPEAIKESLNSFNIIDKDSTFIKFLFNLNENLTDNDKSNQATENLLKQISANKLLNYNNDLITLFLPFFIEQETKTAEIKINKDENNQQEKQSLKFSFIYSSNKLGDIKVKIKLEQSKLSALFINNQQKTHQLIKNNLDNLKENLNDNFNLKLVDSKFISRKEENKENIKLTSIDFKI